MSACYVLCIRPGSTPWVLTADRPETRARCRDAIRWQTQGGYDDARWEICQLSADGRAFVTDAGEHLRPERGPYTEEAWSALCERMGYRP